MEKRVRGFLRMASFFVPAFIIACVSVNAYLIPLVLVVEHCRFVLLHLVLWFFLVFFAPSLSVMQPDEAVVIILDVGSSMTTDRRSTDLLDAALKAVTLLVQQKVRFAKIANHVFAKLDQLLRFK
jgi:hypothetical protein